MGRATILETPVNMNAKSFEALSAMEGQTRKVFLGLGWSVKDQFSATERLERLGIGTVAVGCKNPNEGPYARTTAAHDTEVYISRGYLCLVKPGSLPNPSMLLGFDERDVLSWIKL
jgi:hypothetical protein